VSEMGCLDMRSILSVSVDLVRVSDYLQVEHFNELAEVELSLVWENEL